MKVQQRCVLAVLAILACLQAQAEELMRNPLGMRFVFVPAGEFSMGTRTADVSTIVDEMEAPDPTRIDDEMPLHRVLISEGFWLQQTEVTQSQWLAVMHNRPGPEAYWQHDRWRDLPAVSVSWYMARRFVEELDRLDPRYRYRLPTEAEWEYAARAGTQGVRPWPTAQLAGHAWFIDNSGDVPHPVATRRANAFGLYDMLGNAWEWVSDYYSADTYTQETRVDPQGPADGRLRVRRGGSYHCPLWQTRPAYRAADTADTAYSVIGLRVVAVPLSP